MVTPVAVLRSTNPAKLQDVCLFEKTAAVTIGRGASCEILLSDPRCSTRHCTIIQKQSETGASFFVEDQSTNGTYVNQELVRVMQLGKGSCRQLQPGDEVAILRAQSVGHEQHLAFVFEVSTGSKRRNSSDGGDVHNVGII